MRPDVLPNEAAVVRSVSQAIDTLADDSVMRDLRPDQSAKRGDPDFGLWFRGQGRVDYRWNLTPSILRESLGQNDRYVEEVSLTRHFKAMNPDAESPTASDFDWLVTMQHYRAPTRLLDWTENLLVALYFAVRDEINDEKDASVWILNARRLNYHASATTRASEIAFPSDPDVIARSTLCRVRNRLEWHDVFGRELNRTRVDRAEDRSLRLRKAIKEVQVLGSEVNDLADRELNLRKFDRTQGTSKNPIDLSTREVYKSAEGLYTRLRMPVAVYANRGNRRIRSQAGVFTLHGGKYVPDPHRFEANRAYKNAIGVPISLLEINAARSSKPILKWLRIPAKARADIRLTLSRIGVTDATLFPELEYQSKYLLTRWTHFEDENDE